MGSPELITSIPRALTIAGSDSGGGAGIQADLKTFLALGVHGMSAITALTAQNTKGVSAVHEVPADFVREQIAQVVADIGVDAAKTGMLASAEIVTAVAEASVEFGIEKLVVDPVFVSKNRDRLLAEDAVDSLTNKLFPVSLLITPNLFETSALIGEEVETLDAMRAAARALHEMGPKFVLVKGGHLKGDPIDVLYDGTNYIELRQERIDSPHTHGTGCTLSAAITAYLARGDDLVESVRRGKEFDTGAIRRGLAIGGGHGPTNPGWDSTIR
jgi:hydroxymethylpyrimidine kinase/phosphomethylpyrimidine kinase